MRIVHIELQLWRRMPGDNFWLIYNTKNKELKALNSSGRSGEQATIDFYKNQKLNKIPARGVIWWSGS